MRQMVGWVAVASLGLALMSCGSDPGGNGNGAPAAPTMLAASLVSGGAHLTWKDNSDNETEFMIMRMEVGGAAYAEIATPTFNTAQYHDGSVTAGKTYMYMVHAMNADGTSDASNEVMIAIP